MSEEPNQNDDPSIPDWDREKPYGREWKPGLFLLKALRDYQNSKNFFSKSWAILRHRLWSAVSSSDIPLNSRIEGGLMIPHPNGIVIHPNARVGANVLIFQQVTIGDGGARDGAPRIGNGAILGAGAKILGGIEVGDGAKIGANAVVVKSVPPGATAVGIPAQIVNKN